MRFSRILIHGYFEPIWQPFHAVVVFRPEHDFLFKSASSYCDNFLVVLGFVNMCHVLSFLVRNWLKLRVLDVSVNEE